MGSEEGLSLTKLGPLDAPRHQILEIGAAPRARCRDGSVASAARLLQFCGWVNRQQQAVIDYLLEENRCFAQRRDSALSSETRAIYNGRHASSISSTMPLLAGTRLGVY